MESQDSQSHEGSLYKQDIGLHPTQIWEGFHERAYEGALVSWAEQGHIICIQDTQVAGIAL